MIEPACIHVPCMSCSQNWKTEFADHLFGKLSIYLVYGGICKNISGYLGISQYMVGHTAHYFESGWSSLAAPSCLCCKILPCIDHRLLPRFSLIHCQASKPRFAASKVPPPRVNLIDIAAAPSVRSSAKREGWILVLAELVSDWLESSNSSYRPETMG